MADNISGSAAWLGGVEIVNDQRTYAYLTQCEDFNFKISGDCSCSRIRELAGCDEEPYSTPALDNAPWYDPLIPESANFAGFLVSEFNGLGSTFTREIAETISDGGVLGRSRLASRTLTWRGFLFGSTCCAVAYGLRWLGKQLQGTKNCGNSCFGDDLEILMCCPSEDETTDAFRSMKNVGLLEGPLIISQRKGGGCGCGASCIVEIEFSLGSPQPFLYGTPIPVVDCVNVAENSIDIISSETEDCPPIDCGLPVAQALADFFPDCDPGDLPPVPTYTNTCLSDDVTGFRAVYITAQRSLWDSLSDVVPVITIINNNSIPIYSMRLGFYTSANGNPCGDLINNPPLCDSICDTLGIVFIPGNSQFYIDGRTKKMSLVCGTNTVFPGEPYTSGPFSWPSFDCYGFCMEFAYAPMFLYEAPVEDVCVSLSLVPRTSL